MITGVPDLSAEHDHYAYGAPKRGSNTADPFDTLGDDAIETGISDMAEQHDYYASGGRKRPL